ncbi:hypothetical protein NHX12_009464 [Muraenolepis orangiensis]|uniref:Ig-like domain-containing protein n=1 Tax=Muraenolepis orangiensis TaxID=630683 RepID=A0A9Q0I7Y3_9TELE|nr:hypothetical protein NHX12_009464 [Muraenolepis orangiensis]
MRTMLKTFLLLDAVLLCATQRDDNGGLITTAINENVSLSCQHATAGQCDECDGELVWLRNGALVLLKDGNKGNNSAICVTPVTREDNGAIFTCHLKNNATVKASVTLNVTYAPTLSEIKDVFVEEQEALLLQCDMHANPPVTVAWLFNGSLLEQTAGKVVVTNDGLTTKLTVDRVDRGLHEGTTLKFPLMPMVAGIVVVILTTIMALIAHRKKVTQVTARAHLRPPRHTYTRIFSTAYLFCFLFPVDSAASEAGSVWPLSKKAPDSV